MIKRVVKFATMEVSSVLVKAPVRELAMGSVLVEMMVETEIGFGVMSNWNEDVFSTLVLEKEAMDFMLALIAVEELIEIEVSLGVSVLGEELDVDRLTLVIIEESIDMEVNSRLLKLDGDLEDVDLALVTFESIVLEAGFWLLVLNTDPTDDEMALVIAEVVVELKAKAWLLMLEDILMDVTLRFGLVTAEKSLEENSELLVADKVSIVVSLMLFVNEKLLEKAVESGAPDEMLNELKLLFKLIDDTMDERVELLLIYMELVEIEEAFTGEEKADDELYRVLPPYRELYCA